MSHRLAGTLPMALTLVLLFIMSGCAGSGDGKRDSRRPAEMQPLRVQSNGLVVVLHDILGPEHRESLIQDPGWREYILAIDNLHPAACTIQDIKILNRFGRYLDSATAYEQITTPPDVESELAGDPLWRVPVWPPQQRCNGLGPERTAHGPAGL